MELIREGIYAPRVKRLSVRLTHIDPVLRKHADIFEFSRFLHDLKRELMLQGPDNERVIYKLAATLMKIILRRRGVPALGYIDAINGTKRTFPGFPISHLPSQSIIDHSGNWRTRYKSYTKFIDWIEKHSPNLFS